MLRGCALVHFHSPSLVSKAVDAAKGLLDKIEFGDLASLVGALATLQYNSQPVWLKLESAAQNKLNDNVEALSRLAGGLSKAGRPAALVISAVKKAVFALQSQ